MFVTSQYLNLRYGFNDHPFIRISRQNYFEIKYNSVEAETLPLSVYSA